jgi:hypothetical protein
VRSLATLLILTGSAALAAPVPVTFNKDVLPILQKECQECHRPGEVAPMSFMTYKDTRPWAKGIKSAILAKKMPPWFMDSNYGHFTNERKLTQEQVDTIVKWADSGAIEGDEKDKPAPVKFAEGWSIGKPDMVVEFPHDVSIENTGFMDTLNLVVKVNFPKDTWIKAAEVRPGNPRVVHHMKAWVRPPGSGWLKNAPEGELIKPTAGQFSEATPPSETSSRPRAAQEILAKYNPGVTPQEFTLDGAAKFIAAGSDIVFECHYTPDGKPETDRSRVGIVFADAPPTKRYITITGVENHNFVIPAHASNYEVKAEATIANDASLAWVQPHMHLRAKDYELRAVYNTGESEILMKGKFDYNWQLGYDFAKPVVLPKGTRLISIAHYDNSSNNPYNPNPDIDVRYGPQTVDEMQVSFMGFIVDVQADPNKLFPKKPRSAE